MPIVFAQPIEQYPNHLKFSSVPVFSAGADALFPAANLLTYDSTQVARALTNNFGLTWDLGSQRIFNIISLISSNVGPRTSWTIQTSTDNVTYTARLSGAPFWAHLSAIPAAPPWTEATDPRKGAFERNSSWFMNATEITARYIRIFVNDPDATQMTFGRLFVGRAFTPSMHIQYGSSFNFEDTGTRERTDQGAQILLPGRSIVSAQLKMDFLSTAELYDFVYEFNYWRGSSREILCNIDPSDVPRRQKNLLYATISEGRRITADEFNAWSQTWILESI